MNSTVQVRRPSGIADALRDRAALLEPVGLAAVALVIYLFDLGRGALTDWDEAIYAEVSKEMLRGHHWLTPYWNHHPFFQKPPLLYWAQMLCFRLFGMNEFAVRLPAALAGVGIVLLAYAITRKMAGPLAAVFAGGVLLSTHLFDHSMRLGTTDALLCLFIYLTVYGYVRLMEGDGRWFYLMNAALALGILTKGPAALVAPMAIGLDWVLRGRKRLVTAKQFWLGIAVLAAIALPWHVWMVARFGSRFIDAYVGHQILERTVRPLQQLQRGPMYYLRAIQIGAFPWWVLGMVTAIKLLWRREWKHALPWLLMGVTLVLYMLVVTKWRHYIVPIFPALAMEVGWLLAEASRKWRVVGYGAAIVMAIGVGIAFDHVARWPGDAVSNQEKPLALVAKRMGDPGPFIVVGKAGPMPDLDIRAALFYSSRHVIWQKLPAKLGKLEAAVKEYPVVDVMMEKGTAAVLARKFVVRPVAEIGNAELARVSRKQ